MKGGGFLLGVFIGVILALGLVLLVGVSGMSTHRIDLLPGGTETQGSVSPTSQGVGPTTALSQQGSGENSVGLPVTSVSSGGAPLLQAVTTLVVAAGIGTMFYGLYARRLDAE